MTRRILLAICAVTILALVALGVPLGYAAGQIYKNQETLTLSQQATRGVGSVPSAGITHVTDANLPTTPKHVVLGLYDTNGMRIAGAGPARAGAVSKRALAGSSSSGREDNYYVVAIPILDEEAKIGFARAAAPVSVVANRTYLTWGAMAALATLIVVVAAVAATILSRRLSAPITRLALDAEELGGGNFAVSAMNSGVHEIDTASAALEATAKRLGHLLERERSFSADASHQLSTPLTGLRVTLEAALLDPNADLRLTATAILTEVDRLQKTIEDLLRLARETDASNEPLALANYFAELSDNYAAAMKRAGRQLSTAADDNLPILRGSPAATRQILDVLVNNALIHGGGLVFVHAFRVGEGAVVEVSDEGPGVVGETEAVFVRRGHSATNNGIGLALARSLAVGQNARLILRESGPSPTFALLLPSNHAS